MVKLGLTIKNRLYIKSSKDAKKLNFLMNHYTKACDYVSKVVFDHECNIGKTALHDLTYYIVRRAFHLKAQEANSVIRTVMARYQSVNTQLHNQTKRYKDKYKFKGKRHTFYINKSIQDLWHPIHFYRPQADLVRKNDWSIVHQHGKNLMSISVPYSEPKPKKDRKNKSKNKKHKKHNSRIKVEFYLPKYFRKYLKMKHKLGSSKLVRSGGHIYMNTGITVYLNPMKKIKNLVGNDRGQRFIIYSFDSNKHSPSFSGLAVRRKHSHFLKRRAQLQSKGSRSAKRRLKSISGQENCWTSNVNHLVSKALVSQYGKGTEYVLENLRGVSFEMQNVPKRYKYSRQTWSFYELGQYLTYKALMKQCKVIHINPQYTSKRCPKCGCIMKYDRNHKEHKFVCQNPNCKYKSNDDRIGAMNIRFLGHLQNLGYNRPFIKKDNQIGYHVKVKVTNKKTGKKSYRNKIRYLSRLQGLKLAQRS